MTDSDLADLQALITVNEGRRTFVYDDATGERITKGSVVRGHPTWGIGFNLDALPICTAAIDAQFAFILTPLIAEVTQALPWSASLPAGPFRVLIDIAYNAGLEGLLAFHKMLAFAEAGQFDQAAQEILSSHLAPNRAARLAAVMRA